MKVFTYNQYIKFIHRVRLNAVLQLAEQSAQYNLEKNNNIDTKNEILKILKNSKEMASLINDFLNPKNIIRSEELSLYESEYINKKYISEDWQIIYKNKEKPIFYLIKYQRVFDNEINYKILNLNVDIIQSYSKNKKYEENMQYPLIVPIIIYTGKEKWKSFKSNNQKQLGTYILEKNQIAIEYNIIDINKISNKFLMQKNTSFSKALLKLKSS